MAVKLSFDSSALNDYQSEFLTSESPYLLFSGGFGAGKTTVGALKVLQLAQANPGVPGLIVAQSWTALKSTILRKLYSYFPPNHRPPIKDPQGERYIEICGSPIFLRTAHNPALMDGLDVGWVYADEIRHYSKLAYDIMLGRVRVRCPLSQRAFTSTPAWGWMQEEWNSDKPNRKVIRASSTANAHNLSEGYVENLRLSYSKRMQRAVIDGVFTILEGAVFEDFDPNPKTSPWMLKKQPTRDDMWKGKVFLAVDPGYRRSAWVFIWERGPLDWVIFDQLMPENMSDLACVEKINGMEYPIDEIWVDPAGDQTQSMVALDTFSMLKKINTKGGRGKRSIRSITHFRNKEFGIDKLRVLLGDESGLPIRIRFTEYCAKKELRWRRGIVKDLGALRYPDFKDDKPVSDVPMKDGLTDHSTDALRYWAVGRWMTVPVLRRKDPVLAKLSASGYKVT